MGKKSLLSGVLIFCQSIDIFLKACDLALWYGQCPRPITLDWVWQQSFISDFYTGSGAVHSWCPDAWTFQWDTPQHLENTIRFALFHCCTVSQCKPFFPNAVAPSPVIIPEDSCKVYTAKLTKSSPSLKEHYWNWLTFLEVNY